MSDYWVLTQRLCRIGWLVLVLVTTMVGHIHRAHRRRRDRRDFRKMLERWAA